MAERVGLFADISNLYYCLAKNFKNKLNYKKYFEEVTESYGHIFRAYAYGAQINNQASEFLRCLWNFGYTPRYKEPKEYNNIDTAIDLSPIEEILNLAKRSKFEDKLLQNATDALSHVQTSLNIRKVRKADWDVGLVIDMVKIIDKIDTVVIGSADSDLAPAVEWAKSRGCRCVVFACNISRELKDVADHYREIDEGLLEDK